MKIGIIGAMDEEIAPLLEQVEVVEKITHAQNTFYLANYEGKELIIAKSKVGKVHASITTTIMIEKFNCEKILFTGVAGAICPTLNIGDIIIGEKLCQHDFDITAFGHKAGKIPEIELFLEPDNKLIEIAKQLNKELEVEIKTGTIATGDQFIASKEKKQWILDEFNAHALEMEGAAVAQVCTLFNTPYFILRAISDSGDEEAKDSFEEFVIKSGKISANFLLKMVKKL